MTQVVVAIDRIVNEGIDNVPHIEATTIVNWFWNNVNPNIVYKKSGRFIFRPAITGETILTFVAGKLETLKTVTEPGIVLRNIMAGSAAETYVIEKSKFFNRYDIGDMVFGIEGVPWTECFAKGKLVGFQYPYEEGFIFEAPWGEDMIVSKGDWIGNPIGGSERDVYRIEKDTFANTYELET